MRFSNSVRSYFLQLVAASVIAALAFWSVSFFLVNSYRSVSQHLVEDDIVFLEDISEYSLEITRVHSELLELLSQPSLEPDALHDQATKNLDRVRAVISQIKLSDDGTALHGHREEALIDSKPLLVPLEAYLNSMVDAVEMKLVGSPRSQEFTRTSQRKYANYHMLISRLIVAIGDEIEVEHENELKTIDSVFIWLSILTFACVILLLLWAYSRAKNLTEGLEKIRCSLLQLGNGDINAEIPDRLHHQELQRMSDALKTFKTTQRRLQNTLQELSDIKNELEQRVESRTEALATEIEHHKQAQARLQLAAEVMRSTSEAVVVSNADNLVIEVNDAYCDITGYSREEIIGTNPSLVRSGLHNDQFYEAMWQSLAQKGHWKGEIWDRRKSGEVYPKWLAINVVRNEQGELTNYVGVFTDISDLKSKESQLQKLAHFDPLTNLPNRLLCKERIDQQLLYAERHQRKVAILFIDLDRFKHINDSLGHAAGDELLIEVAQRLEANLRGQDTLSRKEKSSNHTVARLGGDEFIIALGDLIEINVLPEIIERLQTAIRNPIVIRGKQVSVDSSIGISIYPEDGDTYEELSRHADTAMYRAKNSGRNQFVFFTEDMNQQAHRRLELEIEMREALDKGQFEIHYQPKVCSESDQIHGMEALIRWIHPDKGMVPPVEFIQVAEDIGLIIPLGEWILNEACLFCRQINKDLESSLQVAVNISPRQFSDPALVSRIKAALQKSGLPPQQLELEITESVVIGDISDAISKIDEIRNLGVNIALDDFGTGYSSLSYLKRLPIDTLKIDRSFVAHLDNQGRDKDWAIVEAIIRMGQHLDMKIVAEGVENESHGQQLQNQGCDLLQGYHYSKPLPSDLFAAYLSGHDSIKIAPDFSDIKVKEPEGSDA